MNEIVCPNCGNHNPTGSRFCNQCGTSLTPTTHHICPNCQYHNPTNLLYCDNCGTRLSGDTAESPPAEEDAQIPARAFKLPTRELGNTGILDLDALSPENIPNWLKTGTDTDSLPEEEQAEPQPEAGEAVPAEEEAEAGLEQGGVPDWLANLEGELEGEPDQGGDAAAFEAFADWLGELEAEEELSPAPPGEAGTRGESSLQPAEPALAGEDEEPDRPGDALPDWLVQGAPRGTGLLDSRVVPQEPEAPPAPPPAAGADLARPDELPDWLSDLAPTGTGMLPPLDDDIFAALSAEVEVPDWLVEPIAEEEPVLPPAEEEPSQVAAEEPLPADSLAPQATPDWLAELMGPDDYMEDEGAEAEPPAPEAGPPLAPQAAAGAQGEEGAEEALPAWLAELETETEEAAPLEASFPEPPPQADLPPVPPAEEASGEEMAWLEELVAEELPAGQTPPEADLAAAEAEETGEEVAPMPANGQTGQLAGVPEELASEELPDWLRDSLATTSEEEEPSSFTGILPGMPQTGPLGEVSYAELPDWLQPAEGEAFEEALDAAFSAQAEGPGEKQPAAEAAARPLPQELASEPEEAGVPSQAVQLPTPEQIAEAGLVKADIPEWLQKLKPEALREEGEVIERGEPVQETGPLAGMRGVIDIEPVIAQPRQAEGELPQFQVTTAQQKRVALLRYQQRQSPVAARAVTPAHLAPLSLPARLFLSLLLLLAAVVGVVRPEWVPGSERVPAMPGPAAAALEAVDAARGQPVLLAMDYSPALAGELAPQTRLLLSQLAANNSPVLALSQSAAGVALASQELAAVTGLDGRNLGFLPGGATGLRLLAHCLNGTAGCETVAGAARELAASGQAVALIVVISGERDSLVNWIEQVATVVDQPLVAGVTRSLQPVMQPYYRSSQLAGLIEGLPALAAYERQLQGQPGAAQAQWQGQYLLQAVVILLLLAGNVIYLADSLWSRRRKPARRRPARARKKAGEAEETAT